MAGDEREGRSTGSGYAFGELAKAFVTALRHEDEDTRRRAGRRMGQWSEVLQAMASGKLRVGSRTPVSDLPVWATAEVIRGGFATGKAAAGGELRAHERRVIRRAGLPERRDAAFAQSLSEAGLVQLESQLAAGAYAIDLPEDAALLTVAWLVRAGDTAAALDLVETLAPYADRLCFLARRCEPDARDLGIVFRRTVGETAGDLNARRPNTRVAAMREALAVWNPFADELLSLWDAPVRTPGLRWGI